MEFRLLGAFEVVADDGAPLRIDAQKPRALLALLLLDANEIVPADRLIEQLWDARPPPSAAKLVQTYVSQLRKALGRDRIVTKSPGYAVSVASGELDVERFEGLRFSHPHVALGLWRGAPLADFAYEPWAQPEISRLNEAHRGALEDRVDLDLASARHAELIAELETLVAAHPHRERLRGQLMLALYRSGRQTEALAVYRDGRRQLVEELGLQPSPALQQLERAILRQDPSLDAAPRQDAVHPDRLIGRETVLIEVAELLESSRLTTLTGPGGIGKTRLALETARRTAERYDDGIAIVELAAVADPDLVAVEVARALGAPQPTMVALAGYLSTKEQLLVLDNFEQVVAAAPFLEELLDGAHGLTLLVTSRVPLQLQAEARYVVPPLDLPDRACARQPAELASGAIELFVERAREKRPEFELVDENADAVAELCIRLDGLPLALELAAARVDMFSPGAILARLGRRLDVLRTTDDAVPERHRTLRAAIAWSYDLLGPEEKEVFITLAVFSGGFSADAVETVVARDDLVDRLGALLNSSLIRPERSVGDEPRFGMLETIRDYALERLAERDDERELRRRHAAFYCGVAEQAEPGLRGTHQVAWLRKLDAERENLRAALQFAVAEGEAELGLRTAACLWRYWQVRSGLEEGSTILGRLLESTDAVSPTVRAFGLAAASRVAFMRGDLDASEKYGEESLAVERDLGGGPLRPFSLIVLAMVSLARQDTVRAGELLAESITAADELGDWFTHSMALMLRGDFLYATGELDAARHNLEEGVRAAREVGDLRNIARGLSNLGMVGLAQHDWERATRLFEEALTLQRELGDRWGMPRTLVALAVAAHWRGDDEQAEILFDQGLRLQLEADDRPGLASSFEEIAALATHADDHEAAAHLYGAAAILREMVGRHPLALPSRPREKGVEAAREALSAEAFADAWARGRSMTLDDTVVYALERTRRKDDVHYAIH